MACINPNTPEFKAALKRTGNPLLAEIEVSKSLEIKPGVEGLFESNPELANSVYEALGFETVPVGWEKGKTLYDKAKPVKIDFKSGITTLPNGNYLVRAYRTDDTGLGSKGFGQRGEGLYLSLTNPYPGKDVNTVEFEISPSDIITYKKEFSGTIPYEKLTEGKGNFQDRVTLVGGKAFIGGINSSEDLNLEIVLYDKTLINKALASKKKVSNFTTKYLLYDLITPQQKQQALQQYSQYLEQNPNGSVEQFKSWVDEFNRDNQKLNSNIQIFSDNKKGDFDSSSLKDDDLALMLFNKASGANVKSINEITFDNVQYDTTKKDFAFFGGFSRDRSPSLSEVLNQTGMYPEHIMFIGESKVYPNFYEILEKQNGVIENSVKENFDKIFSFGFTSSVFDQIKKELNNSKSETFVFETADGKTFKFPKRFVKGFYKLTSKISQISEENRQNVLDAKVKQIIKEKRESNKKGIKPVIVKEFYNDGSTDILKYAIELIDNSIIKDAVKNAKNIKVVVFSNKEFSEEGVAAWYQPNTNSIYIYKENLRIDKGAFQLLAHELIHGVTHLAINYDTSFKNEIKKLIKEVENKTGKKYKKGNEDSIYGLKDEHEFLSEAFSNPLFKQLLESIEEEKETSLSLWQKFINAIFNLFNKDSKYKTETYKISTLNKLNSIIQTNNFKFYNVSNINDNTRLANFISQKSQERLNQIQEIFNQNPELSKIGTLEQYAIYLDTIFPDSKVKDIVYHFSNVKIDKPNKEKFSLSANINRRKGFFGISENINPGNNFANVEGSIPHAMLFNMKNPDFGDFSILPPVVAKDETKDSAIIKQRGDINYYSVFEPEQIHILGNKQDVKGFKEFVSGKSDIQYQLTSQEIKEADKKLDAKLLNFLSKYGVKSTEINNFKERWGVDALGATDVLNKIIYHSVEKKLDTIPEEAVHMVVMLMGQTHPLIRDLMDNIKDWSGYQAVYDEYMPVYNNEKQVKVEALGKLVTESLLQKWTGKTKEERNLFQKVLEAVTEFLTNLTKPFIIKEGSYFKDAADKIAVNVLQENEAFIGSPTSKIEKLNYEQAVAGNKLAQNIIDTYSGKRFGFKLVGSLAIAGQGENIYRPSKAPIHDLDFIVENDDLETGLEKYNRLIDQMNQINAVPIHGGWENKQKTYTTYAYLIPKQGYKFSNIERNERDNLYKYTILDEKDNVVANVKLVSPKVTVFTDKNDKVLTDEKINSLSQLHIPVDFFVYNVDSNEQFKDIFSSIQDIYFGKLSLSPHGADERMFQREKDQEDYRTSDFKNRDIEKNEFLYLQEEAQSKEKPSENIDNKIKSFLASIGVNIKLVQNLTDSKGNKVSGIAVADMLNKIIQVVEGKADITTLSEEAAHFFVEMLGENNPLYKQMFDKITGYKIYSETVDQYRNNKAYKNADGTLNINKLKKEAIGKLIMTHIIKNETNGENKDKINSAKSWWAKLLEWIKNVFKQNSTNPFAEAAQKIINNDISDLNLDVESNETYFQLEAQSGIEKVIKDQDVIKLDESINPKTGEKKHVYTENGKDIIDKNGNPRSVTNNVVDPWYKNRFPTDSRTDVRKTIDEFSAEKGTDIHSDLESILRRFVDKNGDIKATPGPITKIKTNDVIYGKLEQYVMSLLNEFKGKPGTKFLAEVRLYSRKRNLPGTIDLLIMEPDGTTHIYDWKSQQINKDQTELKWFKPLAYRIQLGEYKKILMEEYGIYKFGKIRAIPIATKYIVSNVNGKLTPTALKDIEMEYNIKNIPADKDYLLPVVMLDESTGDAKIDSLIAKLNAVYEKISIGDVQEAEKAFKHDELNILKKAINDLHIRKDMTVFIENGLYEINKYLRKIKDGTFDLKDVKDSLLILNVYVEGSVYLEKLFVDIKNQLKTETNPDVKEYLQNLQEDFLKMSQNAKALLIDIKGIPGEKNPSGIMARLGSEFAQEEGITTLLNPEVQMDFWKRNFRSLTTLGTAAIDTFAKILRRVQAQRNIKIKDLNSKLQTLRKEHEEWARKKGLSGENIFNPILEIDSKGNWNGDFVRIYSSEYFKLRDEALKNEDAKWFKENTDFDDVAYEKDLQTFKDNVEERYPEKDEKTEHRKQNLIDRWIERHSKNSKVAYFNKKNFYVKPKAKWQSEKYKTIYAKDSSGKYINEPLKNTYEFFQELIKYSSEIGMLDRYSSRFIPGVYQSAVTNILGSSFKNIYDIQSQFESLVVDSESGFGNIDPLTGVLKKQMKVYFKKDLGVEKEDGSIDYSNKSKDLFSVFSIWGQQMYNYEAMDSIRDKSDVLLEIEKIKPRLETNMWNVVKPDKTTIAENTINAGILEDYINYYIYGEIKGSDVDKAIPIKGKDYSLTKAAQKVIKAATFKTLALNVLSGTATFVGGTGNAFFQASKRIIFTEKDWIQGTADFTSNNEVTRSALDFFDLGLNDREKHDVRNLSTSWKKKNLKWGHLLFMQHYGDKWATYPVAATLLRTFMFDGKNIVSIRDFVKKQNDYANFYKLPENERKRVQKKIDNEIAELQKTKSLKAVGKVVNDEFIIPGLDKTSDAAINFRAVVQKTLKGIIGNATRDDMTTIRMGLIGQVLMQYRSWMPQMMAERFGDMTYDVDLETWQYGKARLFLKHIINGRVLPLLKEMIFGFGNNTIEEAKKRHKEFIIRLLAEGKISSADEFMTEAEFVDMYIGNVRSMMRELILLTSFMSLLFWGMGDDDDEDVSGFKKYAKKALQKYQNEFSFYYSPTEFTKMLKNPVPIVGVGEDFERFLTQGIGQIYNFAASDEEGMDKNKPAKYLFKLLPITKEGLNFYALYDDEFRKEWAIK